MLQIGLEPFRADEEILPGDIRAVMFQELMIADLVVADLSISNSNAWYELGGVHHGLLSHGIVQIRSGEVKIPFDVCVDRTLHYHLKEGVPALDFLETDRAALGKVTLGNSGEELLKFAFAMISPVDKFIKQGCLKKSGYLT